MHLFYSPEILNGSLELPQDEAIHCTKVLRRNVGDKIHIIDGQGTKYLAQITNVLGKHVDFSILEQEANFGYFPYKIRMFVAPTKNMDRFEFFVEKAVEMGICEIHPILCSNSERKVIKPERVERIIISAMKQSYKARKPLLLPMRKLSEVLKDDWSGKKFIAHCEDGEKKTLKDFGKQDCTNILIGPEGDFSLEEIALAKQNNWTEISLGNTRLRTETAALAALHSVHFLQL